jgi:hypothetical protein
MRMRIAVIALLAAGGLWWAQSASGQAQPVPGFGSGIVTVQGTVGIGKLPDKLPDIDVGQRGEWRVAVSNTPTVTPALPPVLASAGVRVLVTWPSGESERIVVAQMAGAWARVDGPEGQRWLNLATARAVEQAR